MLSFEGCEKNSFRNDVATLRWPRNSPDLNPIENLQEILKNKVAEKQTSSAGALNHVIKEVWLKKFQKTDL